MVFAFLAKFVPAFHPFHSPPQNLHRFCVLLLPAPGRTVVKALPISRNGTGTVAALGTLPRSQRGALQFSTGKRLILQHAVPIWHLKYKM
jgi:hypothetical protein